MLNISFARSGLLGLVCRVILTVISWIQSCTAGVSLRVIDY